ncbi:MAG TPA: alkaline phosphatase family protein, partial [Chloroflexota bacterium]|nr:alkaline phosphatase family protein [Chloroflexota bacterium]
MASRPRFLLIGMDGMNLPLLRRFAAEGRLPNFSRLMGRGSTNRLLPSLPAWTPNNWATIVTGTTPGSHRLGGWTVRQKTDPWEAPRLESWDSRVIDGTETIWEVAEQAGLKTLIQFYPSAVWPSPIKNGYVVAPGFHDAPYAIAMPMSYFASTGDVRTGVEQIAAEARERTTDRAEEGAPPGSSVVHLSPATGWRNVPSNALSAELPVPLKNGERETLYLLVVPDSSNRAYARIAICSEPNGNASVAELSLGSWSPFYQRALGKAQVPTAMRFRLLAADATAGTVYLCRTEAYATRGFTYPAELDRRLVEACGPFYDWPTIDPVRGEVELETFASDMLYQGEWQVRAAKHVLENGGWDLHFSHWHLFDHINHPTVNPADPDGPNYDPKVGEWMMHCQRRIYEVGDRVLGQFLDLADDKTIVCVTSDHGMAPAHRWGDVPTLLAEKGLLVFKPDGKSIDWSRSVAYNQADRGSEVYVNLRGREPMGIVPPEKYDEVQEAIVD